MKPHLLISSAPQPSSALLSPLLLPLAICCVVVVNHGKYNAKRELQGTYVYKFMYKFIMTIT